LTKPSTDPRDRSLFSDWGDPREYSLGDMGIGECAGEVISAVDFDLAAAERELFEAQVALDDSQIEKAGRGAYQAMLRAALGVVKLENPNAKNDASAVVSEFRARFYDTQKFFDPFAGGKFAQYLFSAHEKANEPYTLDSARYRIDEAHLFIEAAHSYNNRAGTTVPVTA
jgi:sulfite reductase (ferredoxin)